MPKIPLLHSRGLPSVLTVEKETVGCNDQEKVAAYVIENRPST